jgi:hypothetical protein
MGAVLALVGWHAKTASVGGLCGRPGGGKIRSPMKKFIHWLIVAAVVLHLFSCVFLGQSYMPAVPF